MLSKTKMVEAQVVGGVEEERRSNNRRRRGSGGGWILMMCCIDRLINGEAVRTAQNSYSNRVGVGVALECRKMEYRNKSVAFHRRDRMRRNGMRGPRREQRRVPG